MRRATCVLQSIVEPKRPRTTLLFLTEGAENDAHIPRFFPGGVSLCCCMRPVFRRQQAPLVSPTRRDGDATDLLPAALVFIQLAGRMCFIAWLAARPMLGVAVRVPV